MCGVLLQNFLRGLAMPKGLTHPNKQNVFQKFSRRSFLSQKLHFRGGGSSPGTSPFSWCFHHCGLFSHLHLLLYQWTPLPCVWDVTMAGGVASCAFWLSPRPQRREDWIPWEHNPSLLSLVFLWIITGDIASEYSLPPDMQAKIYKNKSISYIPTITSLKIKAIKTIICPWMILRILWDFHAESHKT